MSINVVELFAGVGGFRVGLEKSDKEYFKTVFVNQWEPNKVNQFAFDCYKSHFKTGISDKYSNQDIGLVPLDEIPKHDLLVGGFPCQDYSVAQSGAKGIEGKKGVLWWNIVDIFKFHSPKFILLENVDRLLRSPTDQRGRDFGIILKTLDSQGYDVEWRVINAAEYGMYQKRRRVFIFAYKRDLEINKDTYNNVIFKNGIFAKSFPIKKQTVKIEPYDIRKEHKGLDNKYSELSNKDAQLTDVSDNLEFHFLNSGFMKNGKIYTIKVLPVDDEYFIKKFDDIRTRDKVSEELFLTKDQHNRAEAQKAGKKVDRVKPNGEKYKYSEGRMSFPEDLNLPGRTMLTSEGTINRSSHFIKDFITGKIRKITAEEAEQLNGFEPGWTDTGMSYRQRYFCMGNALVVDIVERIGNIIKEY